MTRTSVATLATFDHLVVAAATLADGIEYIAEMTGAVPRPGGRHEAMGTHNALLRLGKRSFLEIISVDPAGTRPARPRWFDLDDIALASELIERPRLIHWVARCDDIERARAASTIETGPVHPMHRGEFRWRITIPDDGKRPGRGVVPTLIQWDVPAHPADALPLSEVSVAQFAASHPDPTPIRATLAALGVAESLTLTFDRETRLAAMLHTPRGIVTLSS